MNRLRTKCAGLAPWMLATLAGCAPEGYFALQSQVRQLAQDNVKLHEEVDALRSKQELDSMRVWGKVSCNNDQVRDFIKRCENGESANCSNDAWGGAIAFMTTQPYMHMYLWSKEGLRGMVHFRQGQILSLIESHNIFPTTKFLILVQPASAAGKQVDEAMEAGNDLRQHLFLTLRLPRNVKVIGPQLIPCKLKADAITSQFSKHLLRPRQGEPGDNEQRTRVWLFRTDCGAN
mgnify:CR=1 FL=1